MENTQPPSSPELAFWAFSSVAWAQSLVGELRLHKLHGQRKKSSDVQNVLISTKSIWTSLVAQTVKSLPEVQESQVGSLGWEDPLEKATHSSILAWRLQGQRAWWVTAHGVSKSWTRLSD